MKKQKPRPATKTEPTGPALKVEWMATSTLIPYERNPRHNLQSIDKVAASITEFGWRQPIVVAPDHVVIAGHTRLMAAQRLGLHNVPVHVAHGLSDEQIHAYRLADNRVAEESSWDKELLALELKDLLDRNYDMGLTGFGAAEIDELLAEEMKGHRSADPDHAKALPKVAKTRVGDVWLLGAHRLRCGDSRRMADLQSATDNHLADIVWTDQPYNVSIHEKNQSLDRADGGQRSKSGIVQNDALSNEQFQAFLILIMHNLHKMMKPGAPIYVAHSDREGLAFNASFLRAGFKLSNCLIWHKNSMVLGRCDYQSQHEPILYGWKPGKSHTWYGGRKQVTFMELPEDWPFQQLSNGDWQISIGNRVLTVEGKAKLEEWVPTVIHEDRPQRSTVHPTMKPTALVERMLKNSAKPGALVLDAFGGSGTTLIAAERLGMKAALIELDPAYCDVIVDRWEEYTGGQAYREGEPVPRKRRAGKKRIPTVVEEQFEAPPLDDQLVENLSGLNLEEQLNGQPVE